MSDLEEKTRAVWKGARHASVGLEMGVSVALGAGVGWWLDQKYGWAPWGVTIGAFLGIGAAFLSLYRVVVQVQREGEAEEEERRRDG